MSDVANAFHTTETLEVVETRDRVAPLDRPERASRPAKAWRWEISEPYRRAALFLTRAAGNGGPRSVLVSSATAREGTTTAVLHLAHHLRNSYGLRPVVLELSRRKPALATLLGLDADRTLHAALSGIRKPQDCIQRTPSGLAVMPGISSESLNGHRRGFDARLKLLLDKLERAFDIVLVDAPPLLAETDAMMAARVVPRLLLVVEAGRTRQEVLERVVRELSGDGIAIVGTILNKQKRFIPGWVYWWLSR